MDTHPPLIHPIRREDAGALLAIYEEALPLSERKPNDAIVQYLARDDYRVLGASENGQLQGFAILYAAPALPVALLDYIAIDRNVRGGGLGAKLFDAGLQAVGARAVLLEIDSDRAAKDSADPATRRKRFYQQLGCEIVAGLDYRMPILNAQRPPAMELLVHRNGRETRIAKPELETWLNAIFLAVYHQSASASDIADMMSSTPDPIELV